MVRVAGRGLAHSLCWAAPSHGMGRSPAWVQGSSPASAALASWWSPGRVGGCEGERQGASVERVGIPRELWLVPACFQTHWLGGTGGLGAPGGGQEPEELLTAALQQNGLGQRILLEKCKGAPACKPRAWKTCWGLGVWGTQTAWPLLHACAWEMSSGFRSCCLVQSSLVSCQAKMLKSVIFLFCRAV